jgi:HAMP domain-containing protein
MASDYRFDILSVQGGQISGTITASSDQDVPRTLDLLHQGSTVGFATCEPVANSVNLYRFTADIPAEIISDGVQTLLFNLRETEETLGHLSFVAGTPLEADIRAEVSQLRAELELLKKAFRRHCRET